MVAQDMIARSVFVDGKVQGVFFREWSVRMAREIGISGWVRNRRDGRVEVYAVGTARSLDQFLAELKQGPPASRVDHVVVRDAVVEAVEGFTRRETV